LSYTTVGELFLDLKEEFSGGDNKMMKVAELKKIKQGEKTMKKFVQEFKRIARDSRCEERVLVEEFKREMNRVIRRKLMEVESLLRSIKQWYERAVNLNKH